MINKDATTLGKTTLDKTTLRITTFDALSVVMMNFNYAECPSEITLFEIVNLKGIAIYNATEVNGKESAVNRVLDGST
jgi:hypothetical protein